MRFRLRTFLLFCIVAGLVCGIFSLRLRQLREVEDFEARFETLKLDCNSLAGELRQFLLGIDEIDSEGFVMVIPKPGTSKIWVRENRRTFESGYTTFWPENPESLGDAVEVDILCDADFERPRERRYILKIEYDPQHELSAVAATWIRKRIQENHEVSIQTGNLRRSRNRELNLVESQEPPNKSATPTSKSD